MHYSLQLNVENIKEKEKFNTINPPQQKQEKYSQALKNQIQYKNISRNKQKFIRLL